MASPLKRQTPRRLFELLEEQQEPFFLQSHGYKSRIRGSCILRSFVNKFICLNLVKKVVGGGRSKFLDDFSESRRLSCDSSAVNGDIKLKGINHSPISVLELHYSDEGSSDHNHSMEEDNSSFSGTICTHFSLHGEYKRDMHQPRHLLLEYLKEMEEKYSDPCEFQCQKMCWEIIDDEIFPWEKQIEDVSNLKHLSNFDSLETNVDWSKFQAEKRVIGTEIEGIIFEEMREECVFDMLVCTVEP